MSAELAIVIKASALVGAAQAALTSLGGSVSRLNHSIKRSESLAAALKRQIDTGGSVRQITKLEQSYAKLNRTVEKLKQTKSRIDRLSQHKDGLKKQQESILSEWKGALGAASTIALPVKLAIDFESSMADVKKVVDFESPQELKAMERDLLALTRSIPMAGTELAKISAAGGQLGVAKKDLTKFTETIAKMGVAFDMSADQAGDSMAKLANVYKIPIAEIGKLGDAINHLSNKNPAKASDIVNTLGRVGGVAKQFGLSELQTTSLANAFISLGKTPEIAGTAINGMLTKLATADKQSKDFQAALKDMGMEAKQLKKAIAENGEQALVDFLKQVKKLPKADQMGTLVDLFGLQYADDVAVLVGGLETYEQSIKDLQKTGKDGKAEFLGSMEREFQARSETTANQIQLLKNNLAELGIEIGSAVLPAINSLLDSIRPIITGFTDWARANPALAQTLLKVVLGLATFKASSFAVRVGLNAFRQGVVGWLLSVTKFKAGILQIRAAVQASNAAMLIGRTRLIRQRNLLGSTARAAVHVSRGYKRANQSLKAFLSTSARRTAEAVSGSISLPRRNLRWLRRFRLPRLPLPSFSGKGLGIFSRISGILLKGVLVPLKLVGAAVKAIGIGLRLLALNPFGLLIAGLVLAATLIYTHWEPIKAFFAGLWDGLKQGMAPLMPLFDRFADMMSAVGSAMMSALSGVWSFIRPFVQPIIDWFGDFFTVSDTASTSARSFGEAVGLWIGGAVTAVVAWVGGKIDEFKAAFDGGLQGVIALIVNWSPLGAFYSAFAAVMSWFGIELPATFTGFGSMLLDGLINGIKSRAAAVVETVSGLVSRIKSAFTRPTEIRSPSRLFMRYGGWITEGLDKGLNRGAGSPVATVGAMAGRLKTRFGERLGGLRTEVAARVSAAAEDFSAERRRQTVAAGVAGGMTIHFNPTINAPGGDPAQIQTATQMSLREFETMLQRVMADFERRRH